MYDKLRNGPVPLPALAALVILLAAGGIGLALSGNDSKPAAPPPDPSLADIARRSGCRLLEFDKDPKSNPPVSGVVDERVSARDGSYVGRRSPSELASVHAMLHGRVLFQYRPDLPTAQVAALNQLVRREGGKVLLFANETGMRAPVAATAYLTLMMCPAANARTLAALRAFRDRRTDFGQAF